MRYFEKCVTSGSCLHLTVQKSRLWSYQKVIRLSSLIQSKLLEIIVDYIRGEQLRSLFPFLNPATERKGGNGGGLGNSPLYDGDTGQIVWYTYVGEKKRWITWDPGHLQERLPAAVYTLCPDFPSPEELGVKVNTKQTAVTYDKLLEQDPGRRVLRPDLITLNPVETVR